MSIYALVIAGLCYLAASISCFRNEDAPHGVMYLSYCCANGGLIWHELVK
jgi:hypothetical protein